MVSSSREKEDQQLQAFHEEEGEMRHSVCSDDVLRQAISTCEGGMFLANKGGMSERYRFFPS